MAIHWKTKQLRLRHLKRVAKAIPEDNLHMNVIVEQADCGTACCLLGGIGMDPWFQQQDGIEQVVQLWRDEHKIWHSGGANARRAAQFFGITTRDANRLFMLNQTIDHPVGPHAVTKAEVLRKINSITAGRRIRPYKATRS